MAEQKRLGAIENTRGDHQRTHMENTVGKGICPFCELNTALNKVIRSGMYWRMWPNPFAYPHQQHHFIIATFAHRTNILELGEAEWLELRTLLRKTINKFNIPGGAVVCRFGDLAYNAGTLAHLHVHIQVPDNTGPAMAVFGKIQSKDQEALLVRAFTQKV